MLDYNHLPNEKCKKLRQADSNFIISNIELAIDRILGGW